jgi:putative permease
MLMVKMLQEWFNHYFSNPQVITLWLILIGAFLIVILLGGMLQPVFLALIIAYLLEGIVSFLTDYKIPRIVAVLLTFIVFLIILVLLIIGILPLMSQQIAELLQDLPVYISNAQKQLLLLPDRYPEYVSEVQIRQLFDVIRTEITRLGQNLLAITVASLRNLISIAIYLVLVPFLVLFFLKDKELILTWVKKLLPKNLELSEEVWSEANQQVANFVRGKMLEILIVWVVTFITFLLLGLNYAMLLSFFVGISVLVPYIGATVMTFPVLLVAFFQWGIGPQFMYVMIAYGLIQVIDGNILVPILLSEVVNLHPVAIIVAVLLFGGLWGIWGLFLAIPLATLVHAVLKAWLKIHAHKPEDESGQSP